MNPINLWIPMRPVAQGRSRSTRSGHHFTPAKTRQAMAYIQATMRQQYQGPALPGPISIRFLFGFTRPKSNKSAHHTQKPDLSNLIKLVEDAGNGIIWQDDKQIVEYAYAAKFWAEEDGIELTINPLF